MFPELSRGFTGHQSKLANVWISTQIIIHYNIQVAVEWNGVRISLPQETGGVVSLCPWGSIKKTWVFLRWRRKTLMVEPAGKSQGTTRQSRSSFIWYYMDRIAPPFIWISVGVVRNYYNIISKLLVSEQKSPSWGLLRRWWEWFSRLLLLFFVWGGGGGLKTSSFLMSDVCVVLVALTGCQKKYRLL